MACWLRRTDPSAQRCGGLFCIPGSFYLAYHRLRWSLSSSVGLSHTLRIITLMEEGVVLRLNSVTCYSQKQWERVSQERQLIADYEQQAKVPKLTASAKLCISTQCCMQRNEIIFLQ